MEHEGSNILTVEHRVRVYIGYQNWAMSETLYSYMTCISRIYQIPTNININLSLTLWLRNLQTLLPLPLDLPGNSLIGIDDVLIRILPDEESHDLSEDDDETHEYCCCRETGDVSRSICLGP